MSQGGPEVGRYRYSLICAVASHPSEGFVCQRVGLSTRLLMLPI